MLRGAASRCTSSTSSTGRRRRLHSHGSESGLQRPKVPLKSVSDRSSRRLRPGQTIHACQPSRSKGLKAMLFSVRNSGFPGKRSATSAERSDSWGGWRGCDPPRYVFLLRSRRTRFTWSYVTQGPLRLRARAREHEAEIATAMHLHWGSSGPRIWNGSANRLYSQLVPPSTDI